MLLKAKGKTFDIYTPLTGRVTFDRRNTAAEILLTEQNEISSFWFAFQAVITVASFEHGIDLPLCHSVNSISHLEEGDIINIQPNGFFNTVYRVRSKHNFLLFTERCNSNCLMCSQPPKDRDDTAYFFELYRQVIPLIPKGCFELGITGGEPTLLGDRFIYLLEMIRAELPDTEVHCLTNGRSFAWHHVAQRLGALHFDRLMVAVPLYADVADVHDYVVQAENAFNQTILGLYNLARYNQRIELRVVLHKQTIPRLVKLAQFIFRNLPFVEHVAFMGLEQEGYTTFNLEKLWIDPMDYQAELEEAVLYLSNSGMNVSIYNLQLCTLSENLWPYAKKSISDWKNIYFDECRQCDVLDQCGGMFASAVKKHSSNIKRISRAASM